VRAPHIAISDAPNWPRVALIPLGLGDDGALLSALPSLGYDGCVIAATGGGHVPDACVPAIESLAGAMPVVLSSRIVAGHTFERSYGYPGSERDVLARGVLSGTGLSALKARVLLTLCLAADRRDAADRFSSVLQTFQR
jgi:L-asparaginase